MTYHDMHTIVRQLTEYHTHREPFTGVTDKGTAWNDVHVTQVPPLIHQLTNADPASGAGGSGKPASKPPTSLDAIDTYTHIDLAAARWVRDLGEDDPADTIACVRKLYSLAASAHFCGHNKATLEDRKVVCCTVHDVERDIRHWWTQARIVSGWDVAAWAPNNTCPVCEKRRTLRIRPDDQTAMCTGCRETWDTGSIGILAEHVRLENGEELGNVS